MSELDGAPGQPPSWRQRLTGRLGRTAAPLPAGVTLQRTRCAAELPADWDALATRAFARRAFLTHAERHNPCCQRYYWLEQGGRVLAGAIVYTLRLDLLTYLNVRSPAQVHFIGIPASQSGSGLLGPPDQLLRLLPALLAAEPGLIVGLNLDHPLPLPALAWGRTLPTVTIQRGFASVAAYRRALRSSYRRRLERLRESWRGVEVVRSADCRRFDAAMYAQYLDAYQRSEAKLEKLGESFLRQLPAGFELSTYRRDGRLLAWQITLVDGERHDFFLGGYDRATNAVGEHYFNTLRCVVEEAVERGAQLIDLGQTAEVPKLRLGGELVEKTMCGWHGQPAVRWALRQAGAWLSYRRQPPAAHVFSAPTP